MSTLTARTEALNLPPNAPTRDDLKPLTELIERYAPYQGAHPLRFPGIFALRFNTPTELVHGVYKPSVCIVAQGAKRVFLGAEVFEYNEWTMLMSSVELPVAAQVTQASFDRPFLGVTIDLNPQQVAELAHKVYPHGLPPLKDTRGVGVGSITAELVNTATRLLKLIVHDRDRELIAPLVMDEFLIRLLCSSLGSRLAHLGQAESNVQRVARAVKWVRDHFDQPMNVELLAELVHMSPSSLHQHFKGVTGLSPLQFQKNLRLREARRMMLTAQMDVNTASRQVGYMSSSQFIREYRRLFGNAPARDMALLREQGQTMTGRVVG